MPKLYGKIIRGNKFMSFDFSDGEFNEYIGNESEFKSIISKALQPFDIKSGIEPNEQNENIIVVSDKDCICYSYTTANGPHPDRYQDADDLTDWIKFDVGVKKLADVIENYTVQDSSETKDIGTPDFENDEKKFDAIYISSPKPYMSNEIKVFEDVDWHNVEVSITTIGFLKEMSADEPTFIYPIRCEFKDFQSVKSDEGENQFYLTFEAVQIIVEEELIGTNLSYMEENGIMLYFTIKTSDGKEIEFEVDSSRNYYEFEVDLSERMDIIEANFKP